MSNGSNDEDEGAIVFFHPDLGIGGAERLVVDAAVGLKARGHRVVIFTNHCDPNHCFDECYDGTLDVRVRAAGPIPMSIFSRLTILCAILRQLHLILTLYLTGELDNLRPRAFIVDQLSAGLPLLRRLYPRPPVLFYCHFPDLLLASGRAASPLKRAYRVPFDALEEWSMGYATAVAVNSGFTQRVVAQTWPRLAARIKTNIVYPCVDTAKADDDTEDFGDDGRTLILSINRFERKKDIALAIKAFAAIPAAKRSDTRLILAGGYDFRILENREYHRELQSLADTLKLSHHTINNSNGSSSASSDDEIFADVGPEVEVLFLLSVSDALKATLLRLARLLVYTPSNEHFGIVPLEAMLARVPVLAANTGGPVETIQDGRTGWLRAPDDVPAWTKVMEQVLALPDAEIDAIGANGAHRVRSIFSRDSMAERLDNIIDDMTTFAHANPPQKLPLVLRILYSVFQWVAFFLLGLYISNLLRKKSD
ncbi:family 1 glycosyltransferase [Stachybotrys elegans]|uniref:Alpha-1,3/1,6-mannosyltransferase ALG2 n=1 Tax=Stachybotrys elegans TaxID=80388 RepID=A0A8K0SPR6_9HYPO|nr:family 1 glycosyltransferase [Stachybotrys elegans]